ncbi:hypothetical protein HD806DRAFT_243354 [Xylariaceae sp. AK1471]|nr:hypothetical protein HD806DRAFT_243354 [Xylariaceae sp. AK1471]
MPLGNVNPRTVSTAAGQNHARRYRPRPSLPTIDEDEGAAATNEFYKTVIAKFAKMSIDDDDDDDGYLPLPLHTAQPQRPLSLSLPLFLPLAKRSARPLPSTTRFLFQATTSAREKKTAETKPKKGPKARLLHRVRKSKRLRYVQVQVHHTRLAVAQGKGQNRTPSPPRGTRGLPWSWSEQEREIQGRLDVLGETGFLKKAQLCSPFLLFFLIRHLEV